MVWPMNRQVDSADQLFEALRRLRARWPKDGWSWDNRLSCVASSFGIELVDDARAALADCLPHEWNVKNIGSAPAAIREIAEATGGIRPDQMLFSGNPGGRFVGYGLWWPWGNDITISARVGLAGNVSDADRSRLLDLFQVLE
jgi:hypothetical protein